MTLGQAVIDRLLPEYRVRHIFATKLRLAAFLSFWAIYFYFLRDVLGQTKILALIVSLSFFLTGFAYYNILRDKWLLFSFALELTCDLTAITIIVYLTGGPYSPYYTVYLFYAFIVGVLYNYLLAASVALCAVLYYGAFLLLCNFAVIPPLILDYGDKLPIPTYTPVAHFVFASLFLAGIVYTVMASDYFSERRERVLEKRNRELIALHAMSRTIRSAKILQDVIRQVLTGVLEGLNFETVLLLYFDWTNSIAKVYVPRTERLSKIEATLGLNLDGMEIPLELLSQGPFQEVMKHRIIFRKKLREFTEGFDSLLEPEAADRIQNMLGAHRIVLMPVVVETEVLGALMGFSREPFVEDREVSSFEAFANQSALALEVATFIDKLKHINEKLKRANQVKSEFLATMSHELRTPLTAIIGFSELLAEGILGEVTDEQKESLKEVLHNAADLLELINSLLDLTKIESGKMGLDVRKFDLKETVRRVTGTIQPLIQKKRQEFTVRIPPDLELVIGDERKVQQITLNLLANANKFASDGGRIELTVNSYVSWEHMQRTEWHARLDNEDGRFNNGCFEIIVEDNGIGIQKEHLEQIFEMFHQVDSSMTRSFGGTGVGLALAKKFVEMHKGHVWAQSTFGKGAKFIVVIPNKAFET